MKFLYECRLNILYIIPTTGYNIMYMESIGLRSGYDSEWDHGGYRDPTPQFHVLMRQSSRRCWSRKRCCIAFVLLSVLGILLAGALVYIFLLNDPFMIFGGSHNLAVIQNNQTNDSIILSTTIKETSIFVTTSLVSNLPNWKTGCPTISGNDDTVTALFGGVNENGQPVTSIELIPKRKCPILPRLYCQFIRAI